MDDQILKCLSKDFEISGYSSNFSELPERLPPSEYLLSQKEPYLAIATDTRTMNSYKLRIESYSDLVIMEKPHYSRYIGYVLLSTRGTKTPDRIIGSFLMVAHKK